MSNDRIIWPATMHHFALTSKDPNRLADWYIKALGFVSKEPYEGGWILNNAERNLIILPGYNGGVAFSAFAVTEEEQIYRIKAHVTDNGGKVKKFETPLFGDLAFATKDLDGNVFVFGSTEKSEKITQGLPGRLQHIVFTTNRLPEQIGFYTNQLGFRKSDTVVDAEKNPTACFMRSDPEHHSLGLFRAETPRLDHFCFESRCWNDIRDWGDHFSELRIPIIWGAGRHGAGNNLFIFVEDPDGNKPEISAEIERLTFEQEPRIWPHEQRTLNLWGAAWMRS